MKRILITGASRGIGRAIAEKLATPDITLFLHGRDTVALAETCMFVQSQCAGVVKLIHDLATEKDETNLVYLAGAILLVDRFVRHMTAGANLVTFISIAA